MPDEVGKEVRAFATGRSGNLISRTSSGFYGRVPRGNGFRASRIEDPLSAGHAIEDPVKLSAGHAIESFALLRPEFHS
jgi:hypothetical protein